MIARQARAASLLALGALALHQLRYLLAYGGGADAALAGTGHAYLADVAPVAVALALAIGFAALIAPAIGWLASGKSPHRGVLAAAAVFAVGLLAIFGVQEAVEGAVSSGHSGGLAGVVGGGGWIALPLAIGLGLLCALLARWLDRAERVLAVSRAFRWAAPRGDWLGSSPVIIRRRPPSSLPLAFGLTRRGPPSLRFE